MYYTLHSWLNNNEIIATTKESIDKKSIDLCIDYVPN